MKRILSLDIYKALAAIMVIVIHVTATPIVSLTSGAAATVLIAANRFANPAVPMFVFASGLSLYYIYGDKGIVFTEFLKKRLPKILVPYLCWCSIYYAVFLYEGIYSFSPQFFITAVFNGRMLYHLYFVVIIIQFYLVFGVLQYVVKRYSAWIVLPLGIAINLLATQILPPSYMDRSFLTYLIYFLLGCCIAKNLELAEAFMQRHRVMISLGFFSLGGIYAYQFYEAQFFNIGARFIPGFYAYFSFCAVAVIFYYLVSIYIEAASKRARLLGKGLLDLSDGSYYIYLSHPLALIAAGLISTILGITGVIDQMILAFVLVWLTAVPLSIYYAKWKSGLKGATVLGKAAEEIKTTGVKNQYE